MTDRDLRRLNRQKLLELLLEQSRDVAGQAEQIEALHSSLEEKDASILDLRETIAAKDEQIRNLTERLDERDAQLEKLVVLLHENASSKPAEKTPDPAASGEEELPAKTEAPESADAPRAEAPQPADAPIAEGPLRRIMRWFEI